MRPEDKHLFTCLPDCQLMGLCIEREASGEPREGKIAVGTIILERVDHRDWDGKTIQEVILKPWQFSWTMPEAGLDYYNEAVDMALHWDETYKHNLTLVECCMIARDMLQGEIPRDKDLIGCFQYLNPKTAANTRKKWIQAGMRPIKRIGHHEYFSEQ